MAFALVFTACFHPPVGIGEHAEIQQYTEDGRPLINIEVALGSGAAKSLSPELAEKHFNYFEVVFADTTGGVGTLDTSTVYYRAAGFINQSVRISVPAGIYDNAGGNNKAIMMAGMRNLQTGECTLLATGIIVPDFNGNTAEITSQTTRVMFKLTALTAAVTASPDSAFTVDPHNYGKTKIAGTEYPYFGIKTAATAGTGEETEAELSLSGWGALDGNDTQQFIHLVEHGNEELPLAGIGIATEDGDQPLISTADISWRIVNQPGIMTAPNDVIKIRFTSKSTTAYSGMGWLPVRAPVRAFGEVANTQVWQAGSGILRNELNAGEGSNGAGIVILHGNKMYNAGVGPGHTGVWEYVLDLSNPNPQDVPGVWSVYTYEYFGGSNTYHLVPTYKLLGEKPNTSVRITGTAGDIEGLTDPGYGKLPSEAGYIPNPGRRYIDVASGAKVWLVLDNAKMYIQNSVCQNGFNIRAPLIIEEGAEVRMTLANGSVNEFINGYYATYLENNALNIFFSGIAIKKGGKLTIEGYDGSLLCSGTGSGIELLGDKDHQGEPGAAELTITGGVITAMSALSRVPAAYDKLSQSSGAGIGIYNYPSEEAATINITGGRVIARGGYGGSGIGNIFFSPGDRPSDTSRGPWNLNITGGVVIAVGSDREVIYANKGGGGGAGIGGGGSWRYTTNGQNGGNVNISGGMVIAVGGDGIDDAGVPGYGGAGIGGGGNYWYGSPMYNAQAITRTGGNGGTLTISGGTVYTKGGIGSYGIGPGLGQAGLGADAALTITGGLLFADSIKSAGGAYDAGGNTANGILVGPGEVDLSAGIVNFVTPNADFTYAGLLGAISTGSKFIDVYSEYTAAVTAVSSFTVPSPATFTIPPYMTFTLDGSHTLTNNGKGQNDGALVLSGGAAAGGTGYWTGSGTGNP